MRRAARAALGSVLALALAPAAGAWIPEPERAWAMLAQSNLEGGRVKRIEFAVALRDGAGNVTATGRLVSEPGGRSRLELALTEGGVEVHDRSGGELRVTRNGMRVERAAPLLPPLVVLQAGDAMEVAAAVRAMDGDPRRVELGIEGRFDCWVLGGRDPGDFQRNRRPSVWVDQETRQPVRIDVADGVRYRLLDLSPKGSVRFPSRIEIHADGWPIWRLEVAAPASSGARVPAVGTAP